jgi:hypothetical protein
MISVETSTLYDEILHDFDPADQEHYVDIYYHNPKKKWVASLDMDEAYIFLQQINDILKIKCSL